MFVNYQPIIDKAKKELNVCEIYLIDECNKLNMCHYELYLFSNYNFPDIMTFFDKINICDSFMKKHLNDIRLVNWKLVYAHTDDINVSQKFLKIFVEDTKNIFKKILHNTSPYIVEYDMKFMKNSRVRFINLYV